jgi:hypothetical protein
MPFFDRAKGPADRGKPGKYALVKNPAREKFSFQVLITPLAPALPPGGSWRIAMPRHELN